MVMISKNFSVEELMCPCCEQCDMDDEFIVKLQAVRTYAQFPFGVNSGFRCPKHNEIVGGFKNSQHLVGAAVDVSTISWSSAQIYAVLKYAFKVGIKGVGIGKNMIHLDGRNSRGKIWIY